MSNWQKIETAPRDGTFILAHELGRGSYVCCWNKQVEDFVPDGWDLYADAITATHWQPLPEPPTE